VARAASVPAYVVFTDATLTAIAEREPSSEGDLAQISGVGVRKLGLYGPAVLALIGGAEVESVLESHSPATESDD
jgi:DNA helicase-2/ATP-dependent DNA helicase PcrA